MASAPVRTPICRVSECSDPNASRVISASASSIGTGWRLPSGSMRLPKAKARIVAICCGATSGSRHDSASSPSSRASLSAVAWSATSREMGDDLADQIVGNRHQEGETSFSAGQ